MEPVILSAVRTPIGKLKGALSGMRPDDLLASVFAEAVKRSGVEPAQINECFAGCANQAGEDNRNVARMAVLLAGFPETIPAVTVNRLCASGLEAVSQAARLIRTGEAEVVLAGGVESMSRAPYVVSKEDPELRFDTSLGWRFPNPKLAARFPLESMGETAENIADRYGISRAQQDAFAFASHQKAVAAQQAGWFDGEIVTPHLMRGPDWIPGQARNDRDECPRPDTSLEKLASLKPVFRAGGSVTAGNSSGLNDGASALVLASAKYAKEQGLKPMARILGSASAGVDPRLMGIGPVPATQKLLRNLGLGIKNIGLIELNEAFAVQSLGVIRELGLEISRVNISGGAIALGHPLGCSGARILTTLVHNLNRTGNSLGLATLCVGVGQGLSMIVENTMLH